MIKDVEEFGAKLQAKSFPDTDALAQSSIKIYDSRAVKESRIGVSELTNQVLAKEAGIEIRLSG
jgi:hypothetical protein